MQTALSQTLSGQYIPEGGEKDFILILRHNKAPTSGRTPKRKPASRRTRRLVAA